MNLRASFSVNLRSARGFGFVPLTCVALLICVLASITPVKAQSEVSVTGSLGTPRFGHAATLLANGQVLVGGGVGSDGAELYDPQRANGARPASYPAWNQFYGWPMVGAGLHGRECKRRTL
jgi:hypothetical protein